MKSRQYKVVDVGYGADVLEAELNSDTHAGWDVFEILCAVHGGYRIVFVKESK